MSNTPHELPDEFPQFAAKISELKQADAHFAKLAEEYHAEVEMRKKRAALKDELYRMLTA